MTNEEIEGIVVGFLGTPALLHVLLPKTFEADYRDAFDETVKAFRALVSQAYDEAIREVEDLNASGERAYIVKRIRALKDSLKFAEGK
jgi:hypothetical protein